MPTSESLAHATVPSTSTSPWQRRGPIVALLLLAPIISEVLYGATRLSVIFVVIPQIMTWGCGALLIRETVRRWKKGWTAMLLLGIALAVAEEWVIQQTSIAPLVGLAKNAYGRMWGVNWVYFLWAVGYESVWVVMLPVQLTELLFSERRAEVWLRMRGFVIASIVFLLGSFMAWYGWTQRARVKVFHMPPYNPPLLYVIGGVAAAILLIVAGYALPSRRRPENSPPNGLGTRPWLVGVMATILGTLWGVLVLLAFGWCPKLPFSGTMAGGSALGVLALFLLWRWTENHDWSDAHRFSVVFGGILACCIAGFVTFKIGGALRIDWIGKAVFNVAAVAWLIHIRRRFIGASRF